MSMSHCKELYVRSNLSYRQRPAQNFVMCYIFIAGSGFSDTYLYIYMYKIYNLFKKI